MVQISLVGQEQHGDLDRWRECRHHVQGLPGRVEGKPVHNGVYHNGRVAGADAVHGHVPWNLEQGDEFSVERVEHGWITGIRSGGLTNRRFPLRRGGLRGEFSAGKKYLEGKTERIKWNSFMISNFSPLTINHWQAYFKANDKILRYRHDNHGLNMFEHLSTE